MPNIYTDTNVLRYFAAAYANEGLAEDLRGQLLLTPFALLELASQLGASGAEEAFAAFRVLQRVHDAGGGMSLLPWSDDFFRMSLFNLPRRENIITPALTKLYLNIMNAAKAEDLSDEGKEALARFGEIRAEADADFARLVNSVRSGGWPSEAQNREAFARCVARRSGSDPADVDADFVVRNLNAYYVFENNKISAAVQNRDYNIRKHSNDNIDAELLIYLALPTLHFLTSDTGFHRVGISPQARRVHIVDAACLKNAKCASNTLRSILAAVIAA